MIVYLDTSASFKLIAEEQESPFCADYVELGLEREDTFVSSWLLYTEMHCAADRRRAIFPEAVTDTLDVIELIDLEHTDLLRAASSSWSLKSADAIHLATALRTEADIFITYDTELQEAASRTGLTVHSPGAEE